MSVISMVLVVIVAFLAGMEGVLDEFQFHQPLVACTLIGLVTGQLVPCIILGGSLQMIALGWANIGAAVAPDAALAAVASAIILVQGGQGRAGVDTAIAVAIPLAVAGLFLTMIVRTLSVICVHQMDAAAAKGSFKGVEAWHIIAVCLQGIRIDTFPCQQIVHTLWFYPQPTGKLGLCHLLFGYDLFYHFTYVYITLFHIPNTIQSFPKIPIT